MSESDDHNRVSLGRPWEADYWTHELGVSDGELMRIIGKVGNSVTAVRKELRLAPDQERPQMKTQRQSTQGVPLQDRLASFAKDTRERAASLPPGNQRDELLRKARQADIASNDWANLPLRFFG
jgi:hypothetical protein